MTCPSTSRPVSAGSESILMAWGMVAADDMGTPSVSAREIKAMRVSIGTSPFVCGGQTDVVSVSILQPKAFPQAEKQAARGKFGS